MRLHLALTGLLALSPGCSLVFSGAEHQVPTDGGGHAVDGGIDGAVDMDSGREDATPGDGGIDAPCCAVAGGGCADTTSDPGHCGACGVECGQGESCVDGSCGCNGGAECTGGDICCAVGGCTDPATGCSDCGTACGDGEACDMGVCSCESGGPCGASSSCCPGLGCRDTMGSDTAHCGGCGVACGDGEACAGGRCECEGGAACTGRDECCPGTGCVDTMGADPTHCGGCGVACGAGETCAGGSCFCDGGPACAAGSICCPGVGCVDPDTNGDHCGGCGAACGTGESCAAGSCACNGGAECTGGDICCVAGCTDAAIGCTDCSTGCDLPPGGTARSGVVQLDPQIRRADVLFLFDTTGSMASTINQLQGELSTLLAGIRSTIGDTAFGAARFDDFPVADYGTTGDVPFGLEQRVTTEMSDITAGVDALDMPIHFGADGPESQLEALFQAATGDGFRASDGTRWVAPFDPATGFDAARGHGMIGGAGFRAGSLPILVLATDTTFHHHWSDNAVVAGDRASWCGDDMDDLCDEYSMSDFGSAPDQRPKTVAQVLAALEGIGAVVVGVARDEPSNELAADARAELSTFAVRTGAWMPPARGSCETGFRGATRPAESWDPDGSGPATAMDVCPLVYSYSNTENLAASIERGIEDLARDGRFRTLHAEARDDPATAIDERRFFVRGEPVAHDPVTCSAAPPRVDRLAMDGALDTFTNVEPGCLVSFEIVAANDGFVPATCEDQIFDVPIVVIANDAVEADRGRITVRVPGDGSLCAP